MSSTSVIKSFAELSPEQLYDIMKLRIAVFVVEQNCVFQDADGKDPFCHHVLLYRGRQLEAYARVVPPGVSFREPSIGRVVTSAAARGTGAGREVMRLAIRTCRELYGPQPVRIGAQQYAARFYERLGFVTTEFEYDEDGIPHVEMLLSSGVS